MPIILDGTTGITTPGLINTGTETLVNLTTTGNTTLGNAVGDTLNVSADSLVVDSSGNVGVGTASPAAKLHVNGENIIVDRSAGDPYLSFYTSGSATNVNLYGGASTGFRVFTGGSERMRIDSSGNVGIATSSPEASLQVNGANGQLILSAGNAPSSGASTNKWRLGLRELVEGDFNILHYNGTSYDNIVNIRPAGQARFINTIGVGNTTGSTSGAGITFPATQSASSDANTLDDYEEGEWTPTSPTSGYTFSSTSGQYTKIGNVVYIRFAVAFSAIGANTSAVVFQGLPFTVSGGGTGAIREGTATGTIYMASTNGTNGVEINSMDGVSSGSQRTIRINEQYICTFFYYS